MPARAHATLSLWTTDDIYDNDPHDSRLVINSWPPGLLSFNNGHYMTIYKFSLYAQRQIHFKLQSMHLPQKNSELRVGTDLVCVF